MKPEAWAALKALQRAGRREAPLDKGAHIDAMRLRLGMQPQFGTGRGRNKTRKSRRAGRPAKVTRG